MSEMHLGQFPVPHDVKDRLDDLYKKFAQGSQRHLGYPANILYNYRDLHRFFEFTINNIGDPFVEGLYEINTHAFEREVVSFFADLYHAPHGSFWGHVTHGGTEGNMYALYLARVQFPDGVVYYSQSAHYSIAKTLRFMGFPGVVVKSQANGEMDYAELEREIVQNKKPAIIIATIGTTMTGAVDRPEMITEMLRRNAISDFYIHCDSALGGMILPFLDQAPIFDFRLPIDSISVSGHKMIGSPIPCGVVIAHKEHVDRVGRDIEFIGAPDTTLSGSRNGHSSLFVWYAIQRFGAVGFKRVVQECIAVKQYALDRLADMAWDAWAEDCSVTIVIKRPAVQLVKKWQLAVQGDVAHLLIMPNISRKHIDAFVRDLELENSSHQAGTLAVPGAKQVVAARKKFRRAVGR